MKFQIQVILMIIMLFFTTINSTQQTTLNVKAYIYSSSIKISMEIRLNSTLYEKIKISKYLNETIIPKAVINYLNSLGFKDASYHKPFLALRDETKSLIASFLLSGSSVVSYEFKENLTTSYKVNLVWRKFKLTISEDERKILDIDFSKYFGAPLKNWNKINYTENGATKPALHYKYEFEDTSSEFYVVLPEKAEITHIGVDSFNFIVPTSISDKILASPLWILAVIILVDVLALIYRHVSWKAPIKRGE